MKEYAKEKKRKLTKLIEKMSANPCGFVRNPEKDFTRKRKLPFKTVMQMMITIGGNSIKKELLEVEGYDKKTATTSAFIQQREKILPCAFEHLLHEFTNSHKTLKKYRGYRVLASDGSDLHFATNSNDTETYYQAKENVRDTICCI